MSFAARFSSLAEDHEERRTRAAERLVWVRFFGIMVQLFGFVFSPVFLLAAWYFWGYPNSPPRQRLPVGEQSQQGQQSKQVQEPRPNQQPKQGQESQQGQEPKQVQEPQPAPGPAWVQPQPQLASAEPQPVLGPASITAAGFPLSPWAVQQPETASVFDGSAQVGPQYFMPTTYSTPPACVQVGPCIRSDPARIEVYPTEGYTYRCYRQTNEPEQERQSLRRMIGQPLRGLIRLLTAGPTAMGRSAPPCPTINRTTPTPSPTFSSTAASPQRLLVPVEAVGWR
jgi:hypothetical protein